MLTIHCHRCSTTHLVGTRSIVSMHQTSEGPVAYVRCPEGHLTVTEFGRELETPTPPAATPAPAPTPAVASASLADACAA